MCRAAQEAGVPPVTTTAYYELLLIYYSQSIQCTHEIQSLLESRHTVCRADQEAGVPPMSILTGRKKTQFSHLCSSVIPSEA